MLQFVGTDGVFLIPAGRGRNLFQKRGSFPPAMPPGAMRLPILFSRWKISAGTGGYPADEMPCGSNTRFDMPSAFRVALVTAKEPGIISKR